MPSKIFFIFQTNKPESLVECVRHSMYGIPQSFYEEHFSGASTQIGNGDQVFLRLKAQDAFIFGPFTVSEVHSNIKATKKYGSWYEVDTRSTPSDLLPSWINAYPICIFFDRLLINEFKYMLERECENVVGILPRAGSIDQGEALYKLLLSKGENYEEFQGERIREKRPAYPAMNPERRSFKTRRGVSVKSKSERIIDDWLYDHSVRAEYERALNLSGVTIKPDWYLPDVKVVLEHLGMLHDQSYRMRWEQKKNLYDENEIKVITLSEQEIGDIDRALTSKLRPYFPTLK
jgi:hypothetical protein